VGGGADDAGAWYAALTSREEFLKLPEFMPDASTTVAALKEAVRRFADERAWEPFHSPKNLSMALAAEVGELLEHFLWVDSEPSRRVVDDPGKRQSVADELADVAILLLNLSLSTGIDLSDAIESKMVRNAIKYPPPARTP
jgi:NTP pyrophosphatase (non-canonical NTP hydrolase)